MFRSIRRAGGIGADCMRYFERQIRVSLHPVVGDGRSIVVGFVIERGRFGDIRSRIGEQPLLHRRKVPNLAGQYRFRRAGTEAAHERHANAQQAGCD